MREKCFWTDIIAERFPPVPELEPQAKCEAPPEEKPEVEKEENPKANLDNKPEVTPEKKPETNLGIILVVSASIAGALGAAIFLILFRIRKPAKK